VGILRQHGLILGHENHPETSIQEILDAIGDGDEDVVGVALDTGWLATRKVDVMEAMEALLPRIKHIHLKDVVAPPEEPTGYEFKDMGHETCELGKGIVPIEECLQLLVEKNYRGDLSIEHEPEDFNPLEDARNSLISVENWLKKSIASQAPADPVGVAIIGCGNIADRYAKQINSYPHVCLLGAQDIDKDRAENLTGEFGGKVYATLEEILEDDAVEIVVNLTIHHVHAEIIRKCLEAGKHVHTEKPLATTSKEAWELVELAAEKGLRLSSAPTTWLGEAQQTALRKIRAGEIGTPRVAYAEVNWGRIEDWHPNPGPFYDVGVLYDVAVYPITLLTAWFGRVKKVTGAGKVVYPNRRTKEDIPFEVTVEDWASAVIEFECGLMARVTASFYVGWSTRQKGLEIHGDDGHLALDRWDVFESALYRSEGTELVKQVLDEFPAEDIEFARGLSDLAEAIRADRPHKTSGAHAAYVVEVIEAIITSLREGRPVELPNRSNLALPADSK
jgi:predicted dehydrogenase